MNLSETVSCDVLVVGSGAGGLAAATVAAAHGLEVIVAEKDRYVGGTTALSGGFMRLHVDPQQPGLRARRRQGQRRGGTHLLAA